MNVLFNMVSFYCATTEEQNVYHEAVGLMLQHAYQIRNMTCNELADTCFVAPSTIIRLCKKLGYSSFSAFKTDLNNSLASFHYFNDFFPPHISISDYTAYLARMLPLVEQAMDKAQLTEIAQAIYTHKNVYFFCGENSLLSQFFELCLFLGGQHVEFFPRLKDFDRAKKKLGDDSFVIINRPDNAAAVDTDRIILEARSRGSTILLITNTDQVLIGSQIDYRLCFSGERIAILDILGMDILLGALLLRYKEMYLDTSFDFLSQGRGSFRSPASDGSSR